MCDDNIGRAPYVVDVEIERVPAGTNVPHENFPSAGGGIP